jgi:hypothetical protein
MARLICTNCSRPTDTLYKVFSNPGSIQLTTCASCGRDVDPYIEREWLLVIMDCVLHRPGAFRHVLYNRAPFCDLNAVGEADPGGGGRRRRRRRRRPASIAEDPKDGGGCGGGRPSSLVAVAEGTGSGSDDGYGSGSDDGVRHPSASRLGRFARCSVAACSLRACLRRAAAGGSEDRGGDELARELVVSLAHTIAGEAVLVSSTILASSFLNVERSSGSTAGCDAPAASGRASSSEAFFYSRLHLALTMPVLFHVATIFALIWEDSSTVRLLGSMFVLSLQRVAVSVVVEEERRNGGMGRGNNHLGGDATMVDQAGRSTNRQSSARHLPHSLPLVVGLIARTLFVRKWMGPTTIPINGRDLACAGMVPPRSILFEMDSFCIE